MNKIEYAKDGSVTLTTLEYYTSVSLGLDPEFFFQTKDGKVVGSEKVLKMKKVPAYYSPGDEAHNNPPAGYITIDGVQAEFNMAKGVFYCREALASGLRALFVKLNDVLKETDTYKMSSQAVVKLTQEEMDSLSDESKVFGCAESKNIYLKTKNQVSQIPVDPKIYSYRCAGGHIHLGTTNKEELKILREDQRLIKLLDIIVGNTCVLIDTDPSLKERRKVYGRAGEHRIKDYGIEYRTLSNFWLRDYALFSFVMALSRLAVRIIVASNKEILAYNPKYGNYKGKHENFADMIINSVDIQDIEKAINENDPVLAKKNFDKVFPLISNICKNNIDVAVIPQSYFSAFEYFVSKGLDYWFKEDPITHWLKYSYSSRKGWERFMASVIYPDFVKSQNPSRARKGAMSAA